MNKELKKTFKPPFKEERALQSFGNSLIRIAVYPGVLNKGKISDGEIQWLMDAVKEKYKREFREPDEDVDCFECRNYFFDEENLPRCKLKGIMITLDPEIKEPCCGYENKYVKKR